MQDKRRELLKALTLGGGAVAATQLPSTWSKPVVDSVMIPAHAQTTGCFNNITVSSLDQDNNFPRYIIVVDSNGNVIGGCGTDGDMVIQLSGLPDGTYRIFGDSVGPESHTITVSANCATETFVVQTTDNECHTLIATVVIPGDEITPGNGQVVAGPWDCQSGLNCSGASGVQ